MTQSNVYASADYADALLAARRGKNILFVVILFALVIELSLFFIARYAKTLSLPPSPNANPHAQQLLEYLIGIIDFLGVILPLLLCVVLWLGLQVMIIGRLLGTGPMTSAFLLCALLTVLLFPWQSVLNNPAITNDPTSNAMGLKIPGILYTWAEFIHPQLGARFSTDDAAHAVLRWARFVGFPIAAMILLLVIQIRSNRGLRQALGMEPIAAETSPIALERPT